MTRRIEIQFRRLAVTLFKKISVFAISFFLAITGLSSGEAHAISYSTPGYNVTFYDDPGACDTNTFAGCSILYQLITTIPVDPSSAGLFTPFIASGAVPSGADYFSVGFTGYSTPPASYRGSVAFDALNFSINGSGNLITTNPGAEDGINGWKKFAAVPDFTLESVTSASFGTLGGTVLLNPVEGNRFFLIGGTSPSPVCLAPCTQPGFGGFMNTPLISLAGLGDTYALSGYAAIEAVPEPPTIVFLIAGLSAVWLLMRKDLLSKE